jgi:hypothetical protein
MSKEKDPPARALTGAELIYYAKGIRHFRGVFSLDRLPKKVWKRESAIVNLDSIYGSGTHWVCYRKNGNVIQYYDSLGNLRPPEELVIYWRSRDKTNLKITYNYKRMQKIFNCGHLCLNFLRNVSSVW